MDEYRVRPGDAGCIHAVSQPGHPQKNGDDEYLSAIPPLWCAYDSSVSLDSSADLLSDLESLPLIPCARRLERSTSVRPRCREDEIWRLTAQQAGEESLHHVRSQHRSVD